MTPEQDRAREIFDEVIDTPTAEWARLVGHRCGPNDELRHEVMRLLESHRVPESILDSSLVPRPHAHDVRTSHEGARVGPYKLGPVIGRGGMATVYRASRDDGRYQGDVAVKVLDRDRLGPGGARRVRQEREALASLQHPHVARLLDAGETSDGDPYLVMTLVDGVPITEYCAARHLSIDDRLTLFLQVCDAVDAAHRRAILHRDLKPSNILVTAEGHVTLLDFGLARPIHRSAATTLGSHWLTPAYASPEQIRSESLTTSADVYALGVVLFEMITGALPYTADRHDPFAVAHAVTSGATRRARQVDASVPADLEAVIGMALHPDVEGRYASVEQLRDDLVRVREGRPVSARPVGLVSRAWRFARRNTAAVAIGMLVGSIVLGAVGIALWQGRVAARRSAENRRLLYAAEMKLAVQALEGGSANLMRQLLERHVPLPGEDDLRGIEWYLLDHLRPVPDLVVPITSVANAVSWSRDDRWIATAGSDGAITLWDAVAGGSSRVVGRHLGKTWAVSFSPGGQLLATAGTDRMVRVWRVHDGSLVLQIDAHEATVRAVAFTPDGSALISGGEDGVVRGFGIPDGRTLLEFRTATPRIRSLDIAPDGSALALASDSGLVTVRSLAPTPSTRTRRVGSEAMSAVRFSPDGRLVVAASLDGTLVSWSLDRDHSGPGTYVADGMMESVVLSRDGRTLFGAHGPWVSALRLDDWQLRVRTAAHPGRTMAVALSNRGDRLATVGSDQSLRVWPARAEPGLPSLSGHPGGVWALAFSPDGTRLTSAGNDGQVRLWNAVTGALAWTVDTGSRTAKAVTFSGDGRRILAARRDGTVVAIAASTGRVGEAPLRHHAAQGYRLAVSPSGTRLAVASEDRTVSVWDLRTDTLLRVLPHAAPVRGVAFSPDGRHLATGGDDNLVHVWQVETGGEAHQLRGHEDSVNAVRYSPDGTRLISSSGDQTIRVWNVGTRATERVLRGHLDRIWDVAVSPDGSRIASASSDATVRIWDMASGRELVSLTAPMAWRTVAFSPDGEKLAAGNADGSISLWLAPRR